MPFASLLANLDRLARAIEEEEGDSPERRQAAAYIRAGCREAAASPTCDAVGELVPYLASACALLPAPRSDAPSPFWEALAEVMRALGAEPTRPPEGEMVHEPAD